MVLHGIDLNSNAVQEFWTRWKITELGVFGSVLRDDFTPDSDIDFIADFEADSRWDLLDGFRMEDELGTILGRRVEIMTRSGIDSSPNALLRQSILSAAERVYAQR